nr:hypothetical protein [Tanacetum cinerariifolium]
MDLPSKRVLELGCGYGLPGTFACQKGASVVHFQDLSAESVRCTTIPNVPANLQTCYHFVVVESDIPELSKATNLSFSEEDFMDGCSCHDGSIIGYKIYSSQSRKLSGSRVWERANETNHEEGTLKTSQDPLASKIYKVGATNTFISHVECILLQNQFIRETEDTITQTLASQGRTKGYMEQNVYSYVYDDC